MESNRLVRSAGFGGGGREHALGWKPAQSSRVDTLVSLRGNPGLAVDFPAPNLFREFRSRAPGLGCISSRSASLSMYLGDADRVGFVVSARSWPDVSKIIPAPDAVALIQERGDC